jgi:hypothetical protein
MGTAPRFPSTIRIRWGVCARTGMQSISTITPAAGHAEPVDRAVPAHKGRRLAIPDQRVVLDVQRHGLKSVRLVPK